MTEKTETQTQQPQAKPQQDFMITEILHSEPLALHRGTGLTELVTKRRRRQDTGTFGREFLSVEINAGRRLFMDPSVARQLHATLGNMIPKIAAYEAQQTIEREAREKAWEEKQAQHHGGSDDRKTRRTGKTERKRAAAAAAGRPTTPDGRKNQKSANDKATRTAMQSSNGKR